MNKTELREIINNGENSGVEFKRDTEEPRKLAKELVAFANLKGGRVLLGVEKDRTVFGLTRFDPGTGTGDRPRSYDKLEEWVMNACRDKIRPEIIPYFEVIRDIEPGLDVAVVEVERGWSVHHVWHEQHRTYYIRVGTLSREASPEELERLFQRRGAFRLEIRPVSGSSIDDLDQRRLSEYFARIRSQAIPAEEPPPEWRERTEAESRREERELAEAESRREDESRWRKIFDLRLLEWREEQRQAWESLLVNTELLDGGKRHPATVAGLLLFGKNPKRHLPQSGIDAVAYEGIEKDYAARERASLRGPMVVLRAADGSTVETGLVEQAVEFVRRNTRVDAKLMDGARREERWTYPEAAVREAVVNALVHRDYLLSSTDIELSLYSDRLEILSPGRLPNGITTERMRIGCRAARNQLLKDTMRDYGYLEHMGMGVPRKIFKSMLESNGTEPKLVEEGESFLVRLWKDPRPDFGQANSG
jgi:ATP-dependent DNA helicase RecG